MPSGELTVQSTVQRHRSLGALVALLLLCGCVGSALAGGGWVKKPGEGVVRIGFNWKWQPDALRRDTKGELYQSLFNMTHDYRFLYLSGEYGIVEGLECSALLTYLWAAERVDSTSEDPSRFYHGPSDMWFGLKYQIVAEEFPMAVGAVVRLPYLYEAMSVIDGHPQTEIPGLLGRDYELNFSVSHSFNNDLYASTTAGFRFRDGAATNQILWQAEVGGRPPVLDGMLFAKLGIDAVFSVGEPDPSTSKDRFSGKTLERGTHYFDFNDASYIRPQLGLAVKFTPELELGLGYSYIVWGHSTVVYDDFLVQLGYSF